MVDSEEFSINKSKAVSMTEDFTSGVWSEKVLVITQDYEIRGYVFMPKTGKKNRVLSDFVAIKDCEIKHRLIPERRTEYHSFLQLNLSSIILLRPVADEN